MSSQEVDRREFHKLTLAALGGAISGAATISISGCNPPAGSNSKSTPAAGDAKPAAVTLTAAAEALILDEPHTCRGLNSCKGNGRSKDNECAGQGSCASIADASCGGSNDCKGQGGCGANPGMNDCKGQGGCHIPLMDSAWETARIAFETAMTKNEKKYGKAPAKAKK